MERRCSTHAVSRSNHSDTDTFATQLFGSGFISSENYPARYQLATCTYLIDILLTSFLICISRIPLRYLVADRSDAGHRPVASWNLAYHLAR